MATTKTSIRVDTDLANEAMRVLGTKSKTEAVQQALREVIESKTQFASRQDYVLNKLEEEMARLRPLAKRLLHGSGEQQLDSATLNKARKKNH